MAIASGIAKNLNDMQVDTSIDESEIGKIRPGQATSFTVDAFPGRKFGGTRARGCSRLSSVFATRGQV